MKRFTWILILAAVTVTAMAADMDYTRHPGYVSLNDLAAIKDLQATVEVQIRKPLLELVAALNTKSDPDLSQLISNLAVIQLAVEGYLNKDRESIYRAVQLDPLTASLLSLAKIRQMVDELFQAHQAYISF